MGKRGNPTSIKGHRIYTVWEAAEAVRKHKQTVIRWIKFDGLIADTNQKPWLVTGWDLKLFLGHKRQKAKCKLALHHLYCLGCRLPQEPDGKIADYTQKTVTTGMLTALCPSCGSIINKVICRNDLDVIRAKIEITIQQADARIVSSIEAPLYVTLTDEAKTNVKTHIK
ncbi:MAG: hypothetical protein V7723_15135 [Sneathiella sp.]|uniref:hypothetical protein n=1 Tax=Sneathiella sp. TaxID=1964365 RepID=UPI003001AA89